jgi:hypothetical protein
VSVKLSDGKFNSYGPEYNPKFELAVLEEGSVGMNYSQTKFKLVKFPVALFGLLSAQLGANQI